MTRLLLTASTLALMACEARATTLTATPANVAAKVQAAQPGDVVQLESGEYVLHINARKAAPGVTITPASGAHVVASEIVANGSSNLTFDGIEVAMTPAANGVTAAGKGTENIVFNHIKVHQADNQSLASVGFWIRLASNITIQNSEVQWAHRGIAVLDSDHVTIKDNLIHDIKVDGMELAGTTDTTITGNKATNFHPTPGDHPDFIQWWGTAITKTNNLNIEGNHYERGTGGIAQGIFGEDGSNITIKGNSLLGVMYNGIGIARAQDVLIDANFVDGYPDMGTRIIVRGACDRVTISNNTTPAVINYVQAGETPCKSVTQKNNNTRLKPVSVTDQSAYRSWLAQKNAGGGNPR